MIDDQDYMEKISVEHFAVAPQSMTYSAYDSAESIAPDSDFDDEQIRKMLASPLNIRDREESEGQTSSSLLWTRNLNDPVFLESWSFRETRCDVCTEARSKCKATSSLSLRTRKLDDSVVPRDQSFRETWCDVSISRCLQICWPGKCWEITSWWKQGSFAWSSKIWTNLWDKNIKNFSNKLMLKDWNWRTHNTEILSLEENNLACEKNHRWRKRLVLRDTQIWCARENHETLQKLTSRLQKIKNRWILRKKFVEKLN